MSRSEGPVEEGKHQRRSTVTDPQLEYLQLG